MFTDAAISIISALIIAIISLGLIEVGKWVETVIRDRKINVDNKKVAAVMQSLSEAVEKAIGATNQTFVNDLKANGGKLTMENALDAMCRTVQNTMKLLSDDVLEYLNRHYDNVEDMIKVIAESMIGGSKPELKDMIINKIDSTDLDKYSITEVTNQIRETVDSIFDDDTK